MTSKLCPVNVDHFLEVPRTLQDGIVAKKGGKYRTTQSMGFQTVYGVFILNIPRGLSAMDPTGPEE